MSGVESFWPTSSIGWLTFVTLATAVGKTGYDWITGRRKSLTALQESTKETGRKVEQLCEKVEEMEGQLLAVDGLSESVRGLTQEFRGENGQNGWRSIIKDNSKRLTEIEKRHDRLEWLREQDEKRSGGQHRRLADREISNLIPEKREEEE